MIEIKTLTEINEYDIETLGFNGYKTNKIYLAEKCEIVDGLSIKLELVELENEYIKEWGNNKNSADYFEEVLKEGLSLGAYDDNKLIAFVLLSHTKWNNSIWIENIRVSEFYQGTGIGRKLVNEIINIGSIKNARIVGLETQSTNYPAINFYKKCGFKISGIDFSRYPQRENDKEQVAVIMNINIK